MTGLRVIAGSARGQKLRSVPGDRTRPITDRTKSALFNIIGADVLNSSFLDLFAGTGAVGIEALSRGASFARFIDTQRDAIRTISRNLKETGLVGKSEVIQQDAFEFLRINPNKEFDYVYIAPPQYLALWEKAIYVLDKNISWLTGDAWVIVQIHPKEYVELSLEHIMEFDRRRYGSTLLVFYIRKFIENN